MKKIFALVVVIVSMVVLSLNVFAAEGQTDPVKDALKADIKALKTELDGLNSQINSLHDQVMTVKEDIKELHSSAKEAGEKEKLQAAKAYKEQLKALREEIQSLREDKKEVRVELKDAREAKEFETVKADLIKIIDFKKQIIAKIQSKLALLEQIKSSLQ